MNTTTFNQGLLRFLADSPTAFHAVQSLQSTLQQAGFQVLSEKEIWNLQPGKGYVVCRNDSSIIAFIMGTAAIADSGIRMVGAHTDSPCLKLKPNPDKMTKGYYQLGVELYGGVLLHPWFDRDLSLAGRVHFQTAAAEVQSCCIDFKRPIATIPSLAIHLDRTANETHSINAQTDLPPLLMLCNQEQPKLQDFLMEQIRQEHPALQPAEILDYELFFYDTQKPAILGLQQEFIASARLDNLLSCYTAAMGLLHSAQQESAATRLIVCNDHEEVGSASTSGAMGTFLSDLINRIAPDAESRTRALQKSLFISTDNAHGVHPNFVSKHDEQHGPILNQGPVIKLNANQRYATNSETSAYFRMLCKQANVPVQTFVTRTDTACGSTIGPITATKLGIPTIDVGVPTFAMHSIRELAGTTDAHALYQALKKHFAHQ